MTFRPAVSGLLIALTASTAHAGWQDTLKGVLNNPSIQVPAATSAASSLSSGEMVNGLKDALQQGVKLAIDYLGKNGGFLNDPSVFIPMPGVLNKVGGSLRKMGQGKLVDDFEATMNHAAEISMQQATDIFSDAIKQMSIEDAQKILKGSDTAATEYFREKSSARLQQAMLPIIKSATDKTGVTSSYKNLMGSAGFLASFLDTKSLNLDNYITDQAIDGLFLKIAAEEKRIRENPLARSTDLMKKVFGSL